MGADEARASGSGLMIGVHSMNPEISQIMSSRNEPNCVERSASTATGEWVAMSTTLQRIAAISGRATMRCTPSRCNDVMIRRPIHSGVASMRSGAAASV